MDYLKRISAISSIVLLLSAPFSVHAALLSRLGGQAVYDTDLNVTWLANANLALTETFGLPTQNDYVGASPDYIDTRFGTTTYPVATSYVAQMNAYNGGAGYWGVNSWRLPWTPQADSTCQGTDPIYGYDGCTGSELGHLFLTEFGGTLSAPRSNVVFQSDRWSLLVRLGRSKRECAARMGDIRLVDRGQASQLALV